MAVPNLSDDEITNRFTHHDGGFETAPFIDNIHTVFLETALWVNKMVPESREKLLALTDLQRSMIWCVAAISIHGAPDND